MSSELITILEKEAVGEIDRILGEARVQAERMVAEATRQAQEYLAAQRQQLEAERQAAKVRALSAAQVRASALVLQAKDEALHEVLSVAEEELARVQQDKARYGPILRGLIREASGALSGRMTVEANPKDLDLAKQAVRDLKLDAEVKAADDVSGGVRLIADDSRFIVENTLASRVERVKTLLAPEIATLLWG
ncbi:MAG: V-type ATP synthase subunit E [Bacillati bacterium ANGP1]|uniref:V-type proton ATPase subunit E n=1 Tax=Candidatus Segetimicrobium genomatis TaxID=2569760 RepID=A0A537L6Y1_9BACT|nr:MAG: V-type ATP synthase subunit E [Terrabacteria group bacterium ANGP1]